MFEALATGASHVLRPEALLIVIVAVLAATVVGILPTLGGIQVVGLMIPFILQAPPEMGLLLITAFVASTDPGGSITSILINVPGTGTNAATVIDGYPMTQKGEASRAIGASLFSSLTGGVVAVGLALVMIPLIIPLIMAMRVGDIAVMVLVGLASLAGLASGSVLKGLISGFFGMLCGFVGYYYPAATERFTFGTTYLYDGLGIVPVVTGLFGVSAMIDVLMTDQSTIARGLATTRFRDLMVGVKDVVRHWKVWLQSVILGYIVGVTPGIGGSVATFGAYGYARQTSDHPEQFGAGAVEGVIAPEAANHACNHGALLTTLVFGIPGSAVMALIMAALFAVGVTPGLSMVTNHLPMIFTLLIGLLVADILASGLCFLGAPWLIKIAYTPVDFVFPVVMVLVAFGCYAESLSFWSILVAIVFGALGYAMMRLNYSRPAFVLGFVLSALFEFNTFTAIKSAGPFFFTTPISLGLMVIIVFMLLWPLVRKRVTRILRYKEG